MNADNFVALDWNDTKSERLPIACGKMIALIDTAKKTFFSISKRFENLRPWIRVGSMYIANY